MDALTTVLTTEVTTRAEGPNRTVSSGSLRATAIEASFDRETLNRSTLADILAGFGLPDFVSDLDHETTTAALDGAARAARGDA